MKQPTNNSQPSEFESQFEQFRAGAEAADREEPIPNVSLEKGGEQTPRTSDEESSNKDPQNTEDITPSQEDGESTIDSDKSGTKAESDKEGSEKSEKKGESKEDDGSKYSKAKENKKLRQNLSEWQANLKKEEQRIAEEKAQIQREKEELARSKQSKGSDKADDSKASSKADEYDAAADDWMDEARKHERKGEYEEADRKFELAKRARAEAARMRREGSPDARASKEVQAGEQAATQVFWENAQKLIDANPDLKDATKGIGAHVKAILQGEAKFEVEGAGAEIARLIKHSPRGFELAHQLAKVREVAASVPGLQKQLADLKAENERLTKLTSLGGSGPSSRPGPKTFEGMSPDEQLGELERAARELEEARA